MKPEQLSDWQMRVVEEKAVLDEKLGKLVEFIDGETFASLEPLPRHLLSEQRLLMQRYSDVLQKRINLFKREC